MKGGDAVGQIVPSDAVGILDSVAIVATRWHVDVVDALIAGAREAIISRGIAETAVPVLYVPGAFELPLGVQTVLQRYRIEQQLKGNFHYAVIAIGCIIRGETPHFHYIARSTTDALMQLALKHHVPIGFGVLTTETREQALARASQMNNKGREAAEAVLAMAKMMANQ